MVSCSPTSVKYLVFDEALILIDDKNGTIYVQMTSLHQPITRFDDFDPSPNLVGPGAHGRILPSTLIFLATNKLHTNTVILYFTANKRD